MSSAAVSPLLLCPVTLYRKLVDAVGARRNSSKYSKLELHCFGLVLQSGRNRAKESHIQTHKRNVLSKLSMPRIDAS